MIANDLNTSITHLSINFTTFESLIICIWKGIYYFCLFICLFVFLSLYLFIWETRVLSVKVKVYRHNYWILKGQTVISLKKVSLAKQFNLIVYPYHENYHWKYMLTNIARYIPYSQMSHYSPVDLQKKHQYPWNFFRYYIKL